MGLIKLDHTKLDNAAYLLRAREIHVALSGNVNFPSTTTRLAGFLTSINDMQTAQDQWSTAQIGLKQKAISRDNARGQVEDEIRALAGLCEVDAPNDSGKLLSGGWHLRTGGAPVGDMTAPQNLSVTGGDMEGEADLAWEPVYGSNSYIGEHGPAATGPWTQFYVGKKSSCTGRNLVPGQLYWFRFCAVGAKGPGPWSDPAQGRAS